MCSTCSNLGAARVVLDDADRLPGRGLVQDKLIATQLTAPHLWTVYLLNPLTPIVSGFQRALYDGASDRRTDDRVGSPIRTARRERGVARRRVVVTLARSVLLSYAWRLFFRLSGDFAEEL